MVNLDIEQLAQVVRKFKDARMGIPGEFIQENKRYRFIGETLEAEILVITFALGLSNDN